MDYDKDNSYDGCPFMNAVYKIKEGVKESKNRNKEEHDSPFYDPNYF